MTPTFMSGLKHMMRHQGTVEEICSVDHSDLMEWILSIPFEAWPQQNPKGHELMPAMVTDLRWHGFGERARPIVDAVVDEHFPGLTAYQLMLSVVMPGKCIPPHRDLQADDWITRVHVPLVSNEQSRFIVDNEPYVLNPGTAYLVNTLREHAVENSGETPRIHFMFDLRKG